MMWITDTATRIPPVVSTAIQISGTRIRFNRYRSRTEVTEQHILTAFSFLRFPWLLEHENGQIEYTRDRTVLVYTTVAVPRATETEQAVNTMLEKIREVAINNTPFNGTRKNILTFNTANAATNAEALLNALKSDTEKYEELNVRAIVTSAPNHRIHIFKASIEGGTETYIVLNNIDTPAVVFKIAAALMLYIPTTKTIFGDNVERLAQAWLTGDTSLIYPILEEIYSVHEARLKEQQLNNALDALIRCGIDDRTNEFERKINRIQNDINQYYNAIKDLTIKIKRLQGEYVLYLTTDTNNKISQFKEFLQACKGITSLRVSEDSNEIFIVYTTPLLYYDESLVDIYLNSTRPNILNSAPEWKKQLVKDIFKNKTYTLHIESGVAIDWRYHNHKYINPGFERNAEEAVGIPNPHHRYYDCWGDNAPEIHRALEDDDYVTATATIFAAMAGINLSDSAVLEKFIENEFGEYGDYKCLENVETKEKITINEYCRRYNDATNATNQQADTGINF